MSPKQTILGIGMK